MADLETNRRVAVEFYDRVVNQRDETVVELLGDGYVQHNPLVADGPEGLIEFIRFLRTNFPDSRSRVIRTIAEGDLVALHVHSVRVPGSRGRAIIDIFRLKDGKVVEHWDAIQEVPETSANPNGMF